MVRPRVEPIYEPDKEERLKHARELERWGTELRGKFDAEHASATRRSRVQRFLSRNRRHFWRIRAWFWALLVLLLCVLFLVVLYGISRQWLRASFKNTHTTQPIFESDAQQATAPTITCE